MTFLSEFKNYKTLIKKKKKIISSFSKNWQEKCTDTSASNHLRRNIICCASV